MALVTLNQSSGLASGQKGTVGRQPNHPSPSNACDPDDETVISTSLWLEEHSGVGTQTHSTRTQARTGPAEQGQATANSHVESKNAQTQNAVNTVAMWHGARACSHQTRGWHTAAKLVIRPLQEGKEATR
eukprot:12136782-Alexandrium_andersonii.AAC.2